MYSYKNIIRSFFNILFYQYDMFLIANTFIKKFWSKLYNSAKSLLAICLFSMLLLEYKK